MNPIPISEKFKSQFANIQKGPLLDLIKGINCYDLADGVPDKIDPLSTIFVGTNVPTSKAIAFMKKFDLQHFVQLDRSDTFRDIITSCMILRRPGSFIENPIPFFINNFEGTPNYEKYVDTRLWALQSSLQKFDLIEALAKHIQQHSLLRTHEQDILTLTDELITNAFFNAPVDSNGKPLYRETDRMKEVKVKSPVKVFLAHDQFRLVVGCLDPYGSVDRNTLLSSLYSSYADDSASVSSSANAGSGIGCRMIIDRSVAFYLLVKKNVHSIFLGSIHLTRGTKRTQELPKNFHICFY